MPKQLCGMSSKLHKNDTVPKFLKLFRWVPGGRARFFFSSKFLEFKKNLPCEIEFLTREQFENSSWNLARILEQFESNSTWTVQERKIETVQDLFQNLWCSWIFHKLFLNILMTFLEYFVNWCLWTVLTCVLGYFKDFSWTLCVLELFLNLFLTISKTVLELNMVLNCA